MCQSPFASTFLNWKAISVAPYYQMCIETSFSRGANINMEIRFSHIISACRRFFQHFFLFALNWLLMARVFVCVCYFQSTDGAGKSDGVKQFLIEKSNGSCTSFARWKSFNHEIPTYELIALQLHPPNPWPIFIVIKCEINFSKCEWWQLAIVACHFNRNHEL